MRILAYVLISLLMISNAFAQSGSRRIQSGDVTGALGYTPLRSIGAMIGPDILCGTGLNCTSNTISGIAAGTSGQIQYNNSGSLGGFTLNGDATVNTGTGAITLANVNSNVGSFGSATNCVSFTTNAKGLITAASNVICTPNIALVSGLGTGVAAALGVTVGSAGAVLVNGGALGTPSSGVGTNLTALNAGNLSSGTVAAARGGAGTVNGALKANGSGVVSQAACADLSNGSVGCSATWGAWTSFTASPSCGTATFTVNSAKSYTVGKTTHIQYDITVTAIGTCTSTSMGLGLNTPNTANTGASLNGYDSVGGFLVFCYITPAATGYTCRSNTNLVTNSHFYLSGVYENQ